MAIKPIDLKLKPKGGGAGLFAKIGGGLVAGLGAAAAPFTGGGSLAAGLAGGAAIAGTAAATAGSLLGGPKARNSAGVQVLNSALKADNEVKLAKLVDTRKKTLSSGALNAEQAKLVLDPVDSGIAALRERIRVR